MINAGEFRTTITIKKIQRTIDADGFPVEIETNIFGTGNVMCKWVNVHGTDAYIAMQLQTREPATVTMRYSPLVDERCLIYKGTDTEPYEIISIDNIRDRNEWLEIKVQRREEAR